MSSRTAVSGPPHPGTGEAVELPFWRLAVWFGLATGVAEATLLLRKALLHRVLFLGRDFVWMTPAGEVLIFSGAALVLLAACRGRPPSPRFACAVFLALAGWTLALDFPTRIHPAAALALAMGVGMQLARLATRHARWLRRLVNWTLVPLAAVVMLAFAIRVTQHLAERRRLGDLSASRGGSNVLLVVWDTVRADHLGAYGYERATSPNLDRLAAGGVLFERALATAPWTPPSHFAMFTGRYPHEVQRHRHEALAPGHDTLAEVLTERGYATAGFVANFAYASWELGFDQGFLHYEDYPVSLVELAYSTALGRLALSSDWAHRLTGHRDIAGRIGAARLTNRFLKWVSRAPDRPWFVFLNYYDAHDPYEPPEPFDRRFGPATRVPVGETDFWLRQANLRDKKRLTPAELRTEIDAYDGAIAYLDSELGRILDELRRRRSLDDTLVIVTSDHGEQFGEHGLFSHANSLYRQVLHVPLILARPGRVPPGRTVAEPITLRDLPATVMEVAAPARPFSFPGRSLAALWNEDPGDAIAPASPLLSEFQSQRVPPDPRAVGWAVELVRYAREKSLVREGYHYLRKEDGREELYDFENDPREVTNLASDASDTLIRLRSAVDELLGPAEARMSR